MKMILLIMLISAPGVFAAPVRTNKPVTANTTATTPAPVKKPVAVVAAQPASTPSPWRLSYQGEYYGPRFNNFNLSQTQGPDILGQAPSQPEYTNWNHTAKVAYAFTPDFAVGASLRFWSRFDPNVSSFAWKDNRLFFSWMNMIDTDEIGMGTIVDFEFPTSEGSRRTQRVMALNLKNAWSFKTPLRNFGFSAVTLIRNTYSNLPNNAGSGIFLAIYPEISYDLFPDFTLLAQGSFDSSNSYKDIFWDYSQADPDYITLGFQYAFNSHLQVHPGAQYYIADFRDPCFYLEVTAAF